jgi:hypothetical protein
VTTSENCSKVPTEIYVGGLRKIEYIKNFYIPEYDTRKKADQTGLNLKNNLVNLVSRSNQL